MNQSDRERKEHKFPVDFSNRTAALAVMPRGRYLRLRRTIPLLANQSEDCLFLNIYVPGGGEFLINAALEVIIAVHVINVALSEVNRISMTVPRVSCWNFFILMEHAQ
ncbi:hypothetical protein J437_LFUL002561 [Ladona fulva]|uniref:Uncharacterized protein n=1 Tax=Ladona fulva TaxID=123851 RepID=A0A8K0JW90_LADFU|nr:hypothetical protein J437_LFUL002561 [Ladona fulva]